MLKPERAFLERIVFFRRISKILNIWPRFYVNINLMNMRPLSLWNLVEAIQQRIRVIHVLLAYAGKRFREVKKR